MDRPFREALRHALDETGKSLAEVTREAGVSYDQYKGFLQGKSRSTNVDDALRIARALGMSLDDLITGRINVVPNTIAIAGFVGAGAQVPLVDAYEKGDGPQVEAPPGLPKHGVVAVEIQGDSMEPVYSNGDLLFYTRPAHEGVPTEAIGHRCVCEDADGLVWVKQVKLGSAPGLFHLISLNPNSDNMHDVRLKWAARVRLHWPEELANKL